MCEKKVIQIPCTLYIRKVAFPKKKSEVEINSFTISAVFHLKKKIYNYANQFFWNDVRMYITDHLFQKINYSAMKKYPFNNYVLNE